MRRLRDSLLALGYTLGWGLVCRVPHSWARAGFSLAADIAWRREGPSVRQLEANLVRVLGPDVGGKQLRAMSRAAMQSYGRYWLEVFRLPVMPVDKLLKGLAYEGPFDKMWDTLAAGRGVIFALPHMGNWDQAGAWFASQGAGTITAVMERLKPEAVYEKFLSFRERLGMEVLPATGGSARPFGILAQRLRAGNVVVLVADRDVTGNGTEVEFFGEPAMMQPGAAALAVQTGAALVPVVLWFNDHDEWGLRIGDEIGVPAEGTRKQKTAAMMREVATFFEQGIREHPQDWHMLQPLFTADLDPQRRAGSRARATGEPA